MKTAIENLDEQFEGLVHHNPSLTNEEAEGLLMLQGAALEGNELAEQLLGEVLDAEVDGDPSCGWRSVLRRWEQGEE